jgi:N12 class adenine-specific DNA methylase
LNELAKAKTSKNKANLKSWIYKKINDDEKAEEILNHILLSLENDGYIMSSGGKYSFRSPFLKDFWINRFIM